MPAAGITRRQMSVTLAAMTLASSMILVDQTAVPAGLARRDLTTSAAASPKASG